MKSAIYLLCIGMMLASCSKPDENTLEKITDTIIGRYECKSITIQGNPLDINGDGLTGTDMIAEFVGFQMASIRIKEPVRIAAVNDYEEEKTIMIEIPKQRVNYNKKSSEYELESMTYGDGMYICFKYAIDKSGKIMTKPYNEGNSVLGKEYDDMIYLADYRGNSAKEIVLNQQGSFTATIDCTCYDFASGTLLTVPAIFVYERVSYSLY